MKYVAATLLLWAGFAVGAWHGSQERVCRAVELTPVVTVVECP